VSVRASVMVRVSLLQLLCRLGLACISLVLT